MTVKISSLMPAAMVTLLRRRRSLAAAFAACLSSSFWSGLLVRRGAHEASSPLTTGP